MGRASPGRPARLTNTLLRHSSMIPNNASSGHVFSFFDSFGEAAPDNHAPTGEVPSPKPVFREDLDALIKQALDAIPAGCQPGALETHVQAFIEMLVANHARSLVADNALKNLNMRLKALSLAAIGKADWGKRFRGAELTASFNNPTPSSAAAPVDEAAKVTDSLPAFPFGTDLLVPVGWKLLPEGVYQTHSEGDVEVLSAPAMIIGRMISDLDGKEEVRLAWFRDGVWKEHICNRSVVTNKNAIISLSDFGFPVTSGNASAAVEFLRLFEAMNLSRLPRDRIVRQLGWAEDSCTTFMWGSTPITAVSQVPSSSGSSSARSPAVRAVPSQRTASVVRMGGKIRCSTTPIQRSRHRKLRDRSVGRCTGSDHAGR